MPAGVSSPQTSPATRQAMHEILQVKTRGRGARLLVLLTATLVLAGCATSYSLVQPDASGSGSYYTSESSYPDQGYYDSYDTGPYYPGTIGWGYYDGTSPYATPFGWYGGSYDDFGSWPSFTFSLGVSSIWDFPGYWGPWYTTGVPFWGCRDEDCDHDHRHGHHHGRRDPVATISPRPWMSRDHESIPTRIARNRAGPVSIPARPVEGLARGRVLESASFAPRGLVHVRTMHSRPVFRPAGPPPVPASLPRGPRPFAFSPMQEPPARPQMAAPHDFSAPPPAAFRAVPVAPPASHTNRSSLVRIR